MLMNNERAAAEQVMLPEQMAQQPGGLPVEQAMAGGKGLRQPDDAAWRRAVNIRDVEGLG